MVLINVQFFGGRGGDSGSSGGGSNGGGGTRVSDSLDSNTRVGAVAQYLEDAGYDISLTADGSEINATRIIEVPYKDYKNDASWNQRDSFGSKPEPVPNSYNAENKTIQMKESFSIYIKGKDKAIEGTPDQYAKQKIEKVAEATHSPYLKNALKYRKKR